MKRFLALIAVCILLTTVWAAPALPEKFRFVDLQSKANQKLTDNLGTGANGNDLKELPHGVQPFGGVRFAVLNGFIQLGSKVLGKMPGEVAGIKVEQKFARLHILHATCFGGGPNEEGDLGFV